MLVVGPDLQREAVATKGSFAKYRFSDGRDLLLEILGQSMITRRSRHDHEEDRTGRRLEFERLPDIEPCEGLCDGGHRVLREVAHGGSETSLGVGIAYCRQPLMTACERQTPSHSCRSAAF